ncbi:hypothetical protein, partial [Vibrio parahaemolyticus]|uniref:hypothetical protein n=1 Tax=Vibrio parahaemolyticus TaxID=670 RepID=UPI0011744E98
LVFFFMVTHNQQKFVDYGFVMLSKVKFENFYSYGDEFEISFRVGKKPSASYFDITVGDSGERLNKVIASLGPNGAGKT